MRIISIRANTVGQIFIIPYAIFGLQAFVIYAFGDSDYFTFPIGVLAPVFRLNFNLNIPRSHDPIGNVLMAFAAVLSYAATGWITGVAAALCFNFFAKRMGGVDTKYVVLSTDKPTENMASTDTVSTLN